SWLIDSIYLFVPTSFFFSSRRRHTSFSRDWSSDVCSSDLPDEKIMVYTGDPKPMPLVKGKLITKCAGTHLNLPCARFAKEIDNPLQERGAIATFLVGRWYSNAHKLVRAFPEWLDYADANDGLT